MDEEDFELADIEDQAQEVGKLTPREYAKLNGMAPQLVYYHVRQGHLKLEHCICGRRVIDVKLADEFFAEAARKKSGIVEVKHDD